MWGAHESRNDPLLIGMSEDLPATDRETTGSHPRPRAQEELVRRSFAVRPAARGCVCIKLMIRYSPPRDPRGLFELPQPGSTRLDHFDGTQIVGAGEESRSRASRS